MASSSTISPTTRSRTLLFISYRDSTARTTRRPNAVGQYAYEDDPNLNDDEHDRLIAESSSALTSSRHHVLDVDLPPKWVDISDQVHDVLAGTHSKISALEKLHAKHVLPGFTDRTAEEREIESLTTDITRDFRQCQTLIQSIPASVTSGHAFPPNKAGPSRHERLAAQNVMRGLAAQVQDMSATFRKKQRVYLEALQGHAIKNKDLLVASGAVTLKGSEGISDLVDDVKVAALGQKEQQQQLQLQEEPLVLEADIQQRDREVTEIARSITQLAELFRDLSAMVISQGSLLDSIEYNIEQTAVNMEEAVRELDVAQKYQKNTGRRKCIFLLLLIIFGLIVTLIFKPRRSHGTQVHLPSSAAGSASASSAAESAGSLSSAGGVSPVMLPPLPMPSFEIGPGIGALSRRRFGRFG